MEILNCDIFRKWASLSKDYIFKGGAKPINEFPRFFKIYMYKNANYVNIPDLIIKENHKSNFSSLSLFMLKCHWNGFHHETISNFSKEIDITYFARDLDYLEIKNNEAVYEINLNMKDHIGKVIFQMPDVESKEDYILLSSRIFLPELNLTFIDSINEFQINYSQNKRGIGIQDSNINISNTNDSADYFYFDKPFYIHIYIDMIELLSVYINNTQLFETIY